MTKAIGYLRVSTRAQGESGLSLEAQRAKVEAYAALYDLEVVSWVEEVASGASADQREGLQGALERLASGEVEGLIFAKLDRLTRSVVDLQELMTRAGDEGWALHSVADRLDTSSASGRLVASILATVAQWEREVIAERTSAALRAKQRRGEHVGAVPFGWRLSPSGELEPHDEEQERVEEILALRSEGLSYRAIASRVNLPVAKVGRVIRRAA